MPWKEGRIPAHERMTPAEQVTALLAHVDYASARSIAMQNAHKHMRRLSTYHPDQLLVLTSAISTKRAAEFWNEVGERLRPGAIQGLDK